MKLVRHLLIAVLFFALLMFAAVSAFARPGDGPGATGGFVPDGGAVNAAGQEGRSPSLVVQPNSQTPWVALAQNGHVLVSSFSVTPTQWTPQGGELSSLAGAGQPSLALGAAPWAAWTEPLGGTEQVLTGRFDGGAWVHTAALNRDASKNAGHPSLAIGESGPWVAWAEATTAGSQQIVASYAVADAAAPGGYRWQEAGNALNFDVAREGRSPDLIAAGSAMWLVWQEDGGGKASRVFAARSVPDAGSPGGYRWQAVGRQDACLASPGENNCALNGSVQRDAGSIHAAAGVLPTETSVTPWLAFVDRSAAGLSEIRVLHLDPGEVADPTDDRFIPAGPAVNTQCLGRAGYSVQGGRDPDIVFVGKVPHVAWVEQQGDESRLFVCHLADARPGQERWDIDTLDGINRSLIAPAAAPSLGSNGSTPYVAWEEGDDPNVFVAHRYPEDPAWGSNRPPFIRTISWSRESLIQALPPEGGSPQTTQEMITNVFTFTTSCDHVDGWEHIQEIEFKLANEAMTAFHGRYVAADGKVRVEDPNQPGTFLPPVTPGAGVPLTTSLAILDVPQMRIHAPGGSSAVLDIDWPLSFRMPTMNQDFKQLINIVYDGKETGFFEVGAISFDYRVYMPAVKK